MSECYRVARPGGLTVHSFLSPIARNRRHRLLIDADSNPKWEVPDWLIVSGRKP